MAAATAHQREVISFKWMDGACYFMMCVNRKIVRIDMYAPHKKKSRIQVWQTPQHMTDLVQTLTSDFISCNEGYHT